MDFIMELNEPQREALHHEEGPLLILAGAGSGKTKVVTGKIAYLIEKKGVWPSSILAITFTNKAASEMKHRVSKLISEDVDQMWIGTFHSICVRILRMNIDKIGYTKDFTIYDYDDQVTLIKECINELNLNKEMYKERSVLAQVSNLKNSEVRPQDYIDSTSDFYEKNIGRVYELYVKKSKAYNALDFDDLLIQTVRLLREDEELRKYYQNKFQYIFVDEYQDTNEIQYKLIKLLCKENPNLTAVGDNDQSIYKWRGADISNILNFEKDFNNAKIVMLEQNYRSTQNILSVANEIIKNNPQLKEKKLWTSNDQGERAIFKEYNHSYEEEKGVINTIQQLVYKGHSYGDIAIFYRTNAQSRGFEENLMREGIPYRVVGGLKFYDRKEVKDVLSYLKLLANPSDNIALKRIINVPKRGIGASSVQQIEEYAERNALSMLDVILNISDIDELQMRAIKSVKKFANLIKLLLSKVDTISLEDLLETVLFESQYVAELQKENTVEARTRIENIMELSSVVKNFEEEYPGVTLSDFMSTMSLMSDTDKTSDESKGVSLMTVHAAKGLEFPIVFLVGMEEKIFPVSRALEDEDMEEERRLCYVAVTRAQKLLFISAAKNRTLYGNTFVSMRSRFIEEMKDTIEVELLEDKKIGSYTQKLVEFKDYSVESNVQKPKVFSEEYKEKKNNISVGDRVMHKKWGEGMVVSKKPKDDDYEIMIAFDEKGIKKLILSYAPITLVR